MDGIINECLSYAGDEHAKFLRDLSDRYSMPIEEILAILITLNNRYENEFDPFISAFTGDIMNKALDKVKEVEREISNMTSFSNAGEVKVEEKEIKTNSIEEKIDKMNDNILRLIALFDELRDNVGFSKYATIKNYIKVHGVISVDNLTSIFGSYAKVVLNRFVNQGLVEKVARGIYKWSGKNGSSKDNKKEE